MSSFKERYLAGDQVEINIGSREDPEWVPAEITDVNPKLKESLLEKSFYKLTSTKRAVASISEESDVLPGQDAIVLNDRFNNRAIRPKTV